MMIHPRDPGLASDARVDGSTASEEPATIDAAHRLLVIRGLSPVEAGNVVAYTRGLRAAERGWTVAEIKHLLALRTLVARGFIDS